MLLTSSGFARLLNRFLDVFKDWQAAETEM
jgi:hypothetical protein